MKDLLYSRWLHRKTSHVYIVIGECQLEATNQPAVLYVREDDRTGKPWARSREEFLDGRFQATGVHGMILSASSIRTRNMITPFHERTTHRGMTFGLGPAGYDVRIAQSMMLFAGQFTLASTIERFMMPRNVMGFVHDKSTWARRGLSLFNTVIEPGWQGHLTLEMTAHCHGGDGGPLLFEAGDPIAQVVFQLVDATCPSYEGKYQNQPDRPVPALYDGGDRVLPSRSTPCRHHNDGYNACTYCDAVLITGTNLVDRSCSFP